MNKTVMICFNFICAAVMCVSMSPEGFAAGSVPVAENLEIKTYVGESIKGYLSAYDPEQDVVCFEITTEPRKGEIRVEQNGEFIYTPFSGKRGRDYFGYKAIDSQGNVSHEATAIIRIQKK